MGLDLKDVVATTADNAKDLLGHLFWYSIGKQMISREDLNNRLTDVGISEVWLPNEIRPVDAFRRATSEVKTKKPTAVAGVHVNYLVREVFSNSKFVQRNIVMEKVDQNNKELGYETQSGIMKLDKKNGTLSFQADDVEIEEICRQVEQKFYLYRDYYSAQQIRVMVARIASSLAPTPVRRNGVIYFIPNPMNAGLTKLVEFINTLENSEAFKVPVVNTDENVGMVSKKLKDYLDDLLEQIKLSDDLKKGQVKMLVNETNTVIKDFKKYESIISSEQDEFRNKIMLLRSEVMKIIQK